MNFNVLSCRKKIPPQKSGAVFLLGKEGLDWIFLKSNGDEFFTELFSVLNQASDFLTSRKLNCRENKIC
jgi:hypothetical protein